MDSLVHSTFSILFRVENSAAWLPIIKYGIATLDVDHLILTVTVSPEDKKLYKKAISSLVSKIGDDPLMVINGIDTFKEIIKQFNEQYVEKCWVSKQLTWESLGQLRCKIVQQ